MSGQELREAVGFSTGWAQSAPVEAWAVKSSTLGAIRRPSSLHDPCRIAGCVVPRRTIYSSPWHGLGLEIHWN